MDGRTSIVFAHRPGTIALADTVVLLDGGRVVASGPHQELLDTEPRYREVLAAMAADDEQVLDDTIVESGTPVAGTPVAGTPVGGD
jgi:ATP-binding cassette subfamily B protein